jgi:hypothetical protein
MADREKARLSATEAAYRRDSPGSLPPGGPYVVVGSDAAGKQVASVDLEKLLARATPG